MNGLVPVRCCHAWCHGCHAGAKPLNSALETLAGERVGDAFPTQHELLGLPDSPSAVALREKRRGGRPPGARNKRAEDVARAVIEGLGDPLLHLAAIATADVGELMAHGLSAHEAIQEKRLAAIGVLPYLHQRKPLAVDVTGRQVVHLTIETGFGDAEQNQGVVDGFVVQLDDAELEGAANPLASQVEPPRAQLIADQAAQTPPAPLAPAPERQRPPGGAVSARPRLLHARAAVVSQPNRVPEAAVTQAPREPGVGEGLR